ncbi:EF0163 family protein [Enterococcus gallinarum]|uniref:EF0163 family protein n=1 Tax=Enterococcus gallinarum TaxID=1353 RepID=UPI0018AA525D|nr:EF0163 family protein [Enterococcus gallinarum]
MKRVMVILALFVGVLFLSMNYTELQGKYDDQVAELTKLKQEKKDQSIVIAEPQVEEQKSSESQEEKKHREVSEAFVYEYVNFGSIDERNQSLVDFVTEACRKDNALDVKVHADFDSEGTIDSSYQSVTDPSLFIVLGKEESRGASHEFLMEIQFLNDKIDSYVYKYVAQN